MKKCRIGVIGAGGIANGIHLPVLSEFANTEIVAVCDRFPERAEAAAKRFGIPKPYASYGEMLKTEALDAAFVLTEPDSMFRIAVDCLNAGKHVFMEKPMGISEFQANSLRTIAKKNKKLLHVGFNRRYIPLVVEVVRQLEKLTKINQVSGFFYKHSTAVFHEGCATYFICDVIHVIDLVRHLAAGAGGEVKKITTLETISPFTGLPEAWHSMMRFENGVDALIDANYNSGGRVHRFELHGVGASAYINLGFGDSECNAKILCSGASYSIVADGVAPKTVQEFDAVEIAGSSRYEHYYGYRDEDADFVGKVLENPEGTDTARADEDYSTMKLAEAILRARI